METDGAEERGLLGTEKDEEIKERPYIHGPRDNEAKTVERLQKKIESLTKVIERQKKRSLKGKRNLKIRVSKKRRQVKDEKDYFPAEERKRETINEMIERWIKAEEKRHEKETRGIEKENDSSTDSKIEKDGTIDCGNEDQQTSKRRAIYTVKFPGAKPVRIEELGVSVDEKESRRDMD